MRRLVAEVVPPDPPPRLRYTDERDRQRALQVIEDLIQRTDSPTNRALYEKQRERILRAVVEEHDGRPSPTVGPFPSPP